MVRSDEPRDVARDGPLDGPLEEGVVVQQGAVAAMRAICDELRRGGIPAALVPPPGGCGTG